MAGRQSALSPPKLATLLCLTVALHTLYHLQLLVANDTVTTTSCSVSVSSGRCSAADELLLLMKCHTAILSLCGVVMVTVFCWNDAGVLYRVNQYLCVCPLGLSLVMLLRKPQVLTETVKGNINLMSVLLLAVCYFSKPRGGDTPAPARDFDRKTPYDTWILIYGFISVGIYGGDWLRGVDRFCVFGREEVTEVGRLVFDFLMVDRLTISLLVFCGLFYFDNDKKRNMVFAIGCLNLTECFFQLPHVSYALLNAERRQTFLMASSALAFFLGLIPRPKTKPVEKEG